MTEFLLWFKNRYLTDVFQTEIYLVITILNVVDSHVNNSVIMAMYESLIILYYTRFDLNA